MTVAVVVGGRWAGGASWMVVVRGSAVQYYLPSLPDWHSTTFSLPGQWDQTAPPPRMDQGRQSQLMANSYLPKKYVLKLPDTRYLIWNGGLQFYRIQELANSAFARLNPRSGEGCSRAQYQAVEVHKSHVLAEPRFINYHHGHLLLIATELGPYQPVVCYWALELNSLLMSTSATIMILFDKSQVFSSVFQMSTTWLFHAATVSIIGLASNLSPPHFVSSKALSLDNVICLFWNFSQPQTFKVHRSIYFIFSVSFIKPNLCGVPCWIVNLIC